MLYKAQRCSEVPTGQSTSCSYGGGLGQHVKRGLSSHFQLIFGLEDLMLHLDQSVFIDGAGRVILPAGTRSSNAQLRSAVEFGAMGHLCQVTIKPTCQAQASSPAPRQARSQALWLACVRQKSDEGNAALGSWPRRALAGLLSLELQGRRMLPAGHVPSGASRFKVCFEYFNLRYREILECGSV